MYRLLSVIGIFLLAVLLTALPLQAVTYSWGVASGFVDVPTNWTINNGLVPGSAATDNVVVANGGSATISDLHPFAGPIQDFAIGTTDGSSAVVQTGGTVTVNGSTGATWPYGGFCLGQAEGSYGGYQISAGTLNLSGGPYGYASFGIGDRGNGLFSQTGGTVNLIGAGAGTNHSYAIIGWEGSGTNSVMSLTGGQFIQRSVYPWGLWVSLSTNAVLNVGGTANVDLGGGGINMGSGGLATGIVNIGGVDASKGGAGAGGGVLKLSYFHDDGAVQSIVNFHGGTVQVGGSSFFGSLMAVSHAYVYSEGAVIDTNGKNIAIAQPLESPAESDNQGITGITLNGAGSGFIGEPVVTITPAVGDTGTGATARAIMNSSGGIERIVITNPGTGYTAAPTVNIIGGGGVAPTAITASLGANVCGGLTKTGDGILTLAANSTYTGPTVVDKGVLNLPQIRLQSSGITVKHGGTLQGNSNTSMVSYPDTTVESGGTIAPGTINKMLYLKNLNLATGANLKFSISSGGFCDPIWVEQDILPSGSSSIVDIQYSGTLNYETMVMFTSGGILSPNITFRLNGAAGPLFDSDDGRTAIPSISTVTGFGGYVTLNPGGTIDDSVDPAWNNSAGGKWNNAPSSQNWGLPASTDYPNGGNKRAMFTRSLGAGPIGIDLNVNPQLSSMVFDSPTGESYTITPSNNNYIKLQSTMAANWHITVLAGEHKVQSNLKLAAGTGAAAIRVADGAKLTLSGVLSDLDSNAAGFSFDGKGNGMSNEPTYGTLRLEGSNSFTGPVMMTGYGRLEVNNIGLTSVPNGLGQSSPNAANLQINGILAYTGTASIPTTVTTDRGFTLMGPLSNPYDLGILNGIEVPDANVNLKFTGNLATTGYSAFRKMGAGALTFANADVNSLANCDFQIDQGAVILDSGTFNKDHVNIGFQLGTGDLIVGYAADKIAALLLQNGATLNLTSTSRPLVGYGVGATGSITLNDTSKIISASHTYFGWDGVGSLTLNGSSHFQNMEHQVIIGLGVTGSGSVTLNGDGANATDFPLFENIGNPANCYTWGAAGTTGAISITNGTYTESGTMFVGVSTGGNGTIAMTTTAGSLAPATVNAGTLSIGGSYIDGSGNSGPATGVLTMNSGSSITVNGNFLFGQVGNGSGTIGSETGLLAPVGVGGNLFLGYMLTGHGELTVQPTGYVNVNQGFLVGYSESDTDLGASGIVNNYGTILKNANSYSNTIIGRAADSTFNQNAGTFTDGTIVCLGQWGNTGAINLNGGVFSTFSIQAGFMNDATAKGKIVFNGGTLKVNSNSYYAESSGGSCNLISPYEGTMEVFVKTNGAIIDTSGFTANILVPLLEDPESTGGGLIKIGEGTLNLVDGNTYTGDTVVNAGVLNVPSINTPNSTVYVVTDAYLNTTSIVADTLSIGGAPLVLSSPPMSVPEPNTIVLLILGGLASAGLYIRRK